MSTDLATDPSENTSSTKKSRKRARETTHTQTPIKKQKKSAAAGATQQQDEGAERKMMNGHESPEHNNEQQPRVTTMKTQSTRSSKDSKPYQDHQLEALSPFVEETKSLFLGLSPVAHNFPLEGACAEFISPLLLTYYPPVNGVVLSYSNPRLSEKPEPGVQTVDRPSSSSLMGRSIDEYAVTYIWLTVDFLIFRPGVGTLLEGYVNLQNESMLGLLCYNYFNAGIERSRLPKDWSWIDDDETETSAFSKRRKHTSGHFEDADGNMVEGRMLLKVKDFEATLSADGSNGSINIYGTYLGDSDDAMLDASNRQQALVASN